MSSAAARDQPRSRERVDQDSEMRTASNSFRPTPSGAGTGTAVSSRMKAIRDAKRGVPAAGVSQSRSISSIDDREAPAPTSRSRDVPVSKRQQDDRAPSRSSPGEDGNRTIVNGRPAVTIGLGGGGLPSGPRGGRVQR